jgi:hypothetical protein
MIISPSVISPYKIQTFQSGGQTPFSFGNALEFDGVNDVVNTDNISIGVAASFNFWINTDDNWHQSIISNNNSIPYIGYRQSGNSIFFQSTGGALTFSANNLFLLNTWTMITVTKESTSIRVFINSVESVTLAQNYLGTFNQLNVLGRGSNGFFDGKLDESAIWNTALTPTQISNLYNGGSGDYATNYSPANLVAYWRMNGTSGDSTAIDEQGTYNGTLINFDFATCWVAH